MNDSHLERRLGEALDAAARSAVNDAVPPPAPRFADDAPAVRRTRTRLIAPLAAAAVVAAVSISVLALHGGGNGERPRPPAATLAAVDIKLATATDRSYGVGMPVVAYFSRQFSSARSLSAATTATVNGAPVHGAWYFERSAKLPGYPIEGHFRLKRFWPANAKITVAVAARKVPAGPGLAFGNDVRLSFHTGPQVVAVVDDRTHRMIVTRDGKPVGSYPVALGAAGTPTTSGIKVIMQKDPSVCMSGPGFHECGVKYAQQLTYSGEYLHAAPWNAKNIEMGIDSSNGCTNLMPTDAAVLYKTLTVGDVVEYPDATGPPMRASAGYGDWNVPWRTWLRGGLIPTS
jgi:lipoprotein-anchoring transpeptidase ErfK/SrfK